MKRYTLLIILSIAALTMTAQTQNEQWFERANAAYNAGSYDTAVMLYEQILATDVEWAMPTTRCGSTLWPSIATRRH